MKKNKLVRCGKGTLVIAYKKECSEIVIVDKYSSIDAFVDTVYPKGNNPLSPENDTEILEIKWNRKSVSLNNCKWTFKSLQDFLRDKTGYVVTDCDIISTEGKQMIGTTWRKSVHGIEEVREALGEKLFIKGRDGDCKVNFHGDMIRANSQRYQTFLTKGTRCAKCGLGGKFFAKEKKIWEKSFHLEFYGIDENGEEVLMTKDHIIPRSLGGKNSVDNYQTMCTRCNMKKGNRLEE